MCIITFSIYFLFRVILDAGNDCYHCTRGPCSFYSNQLLLLLPVVGLEAKAKWVTLHSLNFAYGILQNTTSTSFVNHVFWQITFLAHNLIEHMKSQLCRKDAYNSLWVQVYFFFSLNNKLDDVATSSASYYSWFNDKKAHSLINVPSDEFHSNSLSQNPL